MTLPWNWQPSLCLTSLIQLYLALFYTAPVARLPDPLQKASKACRELQKQLPSIVHFPGSSEYDKTIQHYESISSQNALCGFAPSVLEDVQTTIELIGRDDIRSPFAIKSGGHAMNPGFSSTKGVQISMHKFLDFEYNARAQTVKIGSGWTWDKVYDRLQPYNRTVIGSRIKDIGMGFLYGGGYSWYTSQHGLAIDNAISFDLVLPNGTFLNVTEKDQPDLFFGIRGGLNNFGIITSATVRTWPSGGIWAGRKTFCLKHNDDVMNALQDFSMNNEDERATMNAGYFVTNNASFWEISFFYDAPDLSPVPFKAFQSIPTLRDTTKITTHDKFIKEGALVPGVGGLINEVPILRYTVSILRAAQSVVDSAHAAAFASNRSVRNTIWFAQPFHNHFAHSTFPSAYPHSPSNPTTPSNFWFDFTNSEDYSYFRELIKKAGDDLQSVVVAEKQGKWSDVKYSNYAIPGTPLDIVFGESLQRMREIKRRIDPKDVMSLLGDGFLV